jgi:hypothetical protein
MVDGDSMPPSSALFGDNGANVGGAWPGRKDGAKNG